MASVPDTVTMKEPKSTDASLISLIFNVILFLIFHKLVWGLLKSITLRYHARAISKLCRKIVVKLFRTLCYLHLVS